MTNIERIKNRMLQNANLNEHLIEAEFEPLTEAFAEAFATEFHQLKMNEDWRQRQIQERLEMLVRPQKSNRNIPKNGILRVQPERPTALLKANTRFETTGNQNVYFSTVFDTKIFNAAIQFLVSQEEILRQQTSFQKQPMPAQFWQQNIRKNEFWMGLKMDEKIDNLGDLRFYFSETGWEESYWSKLVNLLKLECQTGELSFEKGLETPNNEQIITDFQEHIFEQNFVIEPLQKYQSTFLALNNQHFNFSENSSKIPFEFNANSSETDLFSEDLFWIKCSLPIELPKQFLTKMNCAINCFPVVNRRLVVMDKNLRDTKHIVALNAHENEENYFGQEHFLGLQQIHAARELKTYRPAIVRNLEDVKSETYFLQRSEVSTFNYRQIREGIEQWLHLFKQESEIMVQIFRARGHRNEVEGTLKKLQENLNQLEDSVSNEATKAPIWLVHLNTGRREENLFLHYWVSQKIDLVRQFSEMELIDNQGIRLNTVFLMNKF